MIDRTGRDKLAQLLENVSAGRTSEDEFLRELPEGSQDRAVTEIADQAYWISPELAREDFREDIGTWVLFLRADLEYEWPPPSCEVSYAKSLAIGTLSAALLGALSLFVLESLTAFLVSVMLSFLAAVLWQIVRGGILDNAYDDAGDNDVWPFIRRSDYEGALKTRTA